MIFKACRQLAATRRQYEGSQRALRDVLSELRQARDEYQEVVTKYNRLLAKHDRVVKQCNDAGVKVYRLKGQVLPIKRKLRKQTEAIRHLIGYAHHHIDCALEEPDDRGCNCGFEQAVTQAMDSLVYNPEVYNQT